MILMEKRIDPKKCAHRNVGKITKSESAIASSDPPVYHFSAKCDLCGTPVWLHSTAHRLPTQWRPNTEPCGCPHPNATKPES